MTFLYVPPLTGALRQGEILGEIWEHIPQYPPIGSQQGQSFPFDSVRHEMVVVMSPGCDLEWDFKARFPDQPSQEQLLSPPDLQENASLIPHVFLANVYIKPEIRSRITGSDIWKRIEGNQDERYHHFKEAPVGEPPVRQLPDLYIDFKKSIAIPTNRLYEGVRVGGVTRIATIPDNYLHDLIHRYFGFLSRIALPDQ